MNFKNVKELLLSLCALLPLVALVACSSTSVNDHHGRDIALPPNSVGSDRAALAKDMITGVGLFIERKLDCTDWSLVEVKESKSADQLVFTRDGQLYRGTVTEKWSLVQCEQPLDLELKASPGEQGGSAIRIRKI